MLGKGAPPPLTLALAPMITRHTYPDLLTTGGRLAATVWGGATPAQAVAATLALDTAAIVLRITDTAGRTIAQGLAPGGLAA